MEQLASLQNCLLSKADDLNLAVAVDVLMNLENVDGSDRVNCHLLQLTLLQTILEKASTTKKLQDLISVLLDKGITSHLVTLLCDANQFISYMGVKVLSAVTICSDRKELEDRWYHHMLDIANQRSKEKMSAHIVSHILDYFIKIMSSTKFSGKATCLNSLSKRWKGLCTEYLSDDVFRSNCLVVTSFIDLWRKSVKLCRSDMGRYQNEFHVFLLHSHQLPGIVKLSHQLPGIVKLVHQPILLRQILKLINLLLSSCTILTAKKCITLETNALIQKLAERICKEDFICIQFSNRHVGFSGSQCQMPSCSVEGETTAPFQNLPLFRCFCAVVISGSAVLVRSAIATTDSSGGQYISSAIESLHLLERHASEMITDERRPEMVADERRPWFSCLRYIFQDQDDKWIDILLTLLDIYMLLKNSKLNQLDLSSLLRDLNPHRLFMQFIQSASYDHSVLVDLLTSPETCFLLYLVKYLKCVVSEWDSFVESHVQSVSYASVLETVEEMDASESTKSDHVKIASYSECAHDRDVELNREAKVERCSLNRTDSLLPTQSSGLTLLSYYDQSDSSDSNDAGMTTEIDTKIRKDQNSEPCRGDQCLNIANSQNETLNVIQKSPTNTSQCEIESISFTAEINVAMPSKFGTTHFRFEEQRKNESNSCSFENPTFTNNVTIKLDGIMTLFIRLRILLEKLNSSGLFPYNVTSLLILLNKCEELYEQ